MTKVIECPCGLVLRADDEHELVRRAQEHARSLHEMELTTEQALSMARPE
jgi:predicted small metal-binding protein